MDLLARVTECERRLANLLMLGQVSAIDQLQARLQVTCGALLTPWLPWLTQRAGSDITWWTPSVGEQVLVLSPQGEPALGVVLPALYQDQFSAPTHEPDRFQVNFADGAMISYDKAGHQLNVTLPTEGQIDLVVPEGITITGNLTVKGNISASQIRDDTRSMAEDRELFNQHSHRSPETGAQTSSPEVTQ